MSSPSTAVSVDDRALALLGGGAEAEQVALALGVTVSRISQLLSNEDFKNAVLELKYQKLSSHNSRDDALDKIEDKLVQKLGKSIDLMLRPETQLSAFKIVNGAKRRGSTAPGGVVNSQTIVNLIMPTQVIQKFSVNQHNQVVTVGDESMVTMQSSALLRTAEEKEIERLETSDEK